MTIHLRAGASLALPSEKGFTANQFMMITFTPSPPSPQVIEFAQPKYGGEPTVVLSHGYKYVVTGNTLLPSALIEATLSAVVTPKQALSILLKAYYRNGYTLVALTGQVVGKTVQISIFQGMLANVQAPDELTSYFTDLTKRQDIRNPDIIRDQILAGNYASRSGNKVEVNLSPASNPGGSVLAVTQSKQTDYFPVSGSANFGNYGSRYSSGYVAGGNVAVNATHGIQITANFLEGLPGLRSESFGSNYYQNGVGASIVTPYGVYGISADWTHYRLGQVTYPLNPDGNIFGYQLNGTQLLYADTATRLSLTEAFNRVRYRETAFNDYYTLLNQQYNYLSLGENINHGLTVDGLTGNLSGGLTVNLGISGSAGTLVDNTPGAPTSHFRYANFTFGYQQNLPLGLEANLTGQAQASADSLPSQQQWVLGGLGNLAAWEPGVIAGDSGYIVRFELDSWSYRFFGSTILLGAFLETGGAAYRTPAQDTAPWQTLTDVGLNLKLNLPYGLSAIAMTAKPIDESGFTAAGNSDLKLNQLNAFFVVQKGF